MSLRGNLTRALMLTALLGQAQAAPASFGGITLGSAGPDGLNLGIFVTGATTFTASGATTLLDTNLGLGAGSTTNVSGGGALLGNLYLDSGPPAATLQGNFNTQFVVNGSISSQSLATQLSDVQAAAGGAASLAADRRLRSVGRSSYTITDAAGVANGFGGKNTVVKAGAIKIDTPTVELTINGTAKDWFIINVASVTLAYGNIRLSGGVTANHVLFNITSPGDSLTVATPSVLYGTYLAPNANQAISLSEGVLNGAVIGGQVRTANGFSVNSSPYAPLPAPAVLTLSALSLAAVPVPLPAAAWLFPSALGLLGLRRRLTVRRGDPRG